MNLHDTAYALMRDGKGVLAADEDTATLEKRFSIFNIPCTEDSRRRYRELVFTTPGIESFLSAVILSEEGMRQSSASGNIFSELIASKDILVGVHLDENVPGDVSRIQEYKSLAAVCVKKRITIEVADTSSENFRTETQSLAEFARACQEKSLVPILGLELVQVGPHTAAQAEDALIKGLSVLVDSLQTSGVDYKGLIIETSMASTGTENPLPAESREVAERTVRALSVAVPASIGGILFFSDGETPESATADLNAIARLEPFPWSVAFCFSRALQEPVLKVWLGQEENVADAQAALYARLALNVRADGAGYGLGMEAT